MKPRSMSMQDHKIGSRNDSNYHYHNNGNRNANSFNNDQTNIPDFKNNQSSTSPLNRYSLA